MSGFKGFYSGLAALGNFLQHFLLLAFRLYWGYGFHVAGCDKFGNIGQTAQFFASLGVPAPELMVYIVATIECVGGWCLILGFASRLAAIPLAATMIAALTTAHSSQAAMIFSNAQEFLAQTPVTFLMTTLIVFCFGPGWFSIDYLLERFFFKKKNHAQK